MAVLLSILEKFLDFIICFDSILVTCLNLGLNLNFDHPSILQ